MGNYDVSNATPESATDSQIQYALKNLHTAIPVKVENFNPQNQTVTCVAQIKNVLIEANEAGEILQKNVEIPPLVDVPVSFPRGGGFAITFPLQAGDEGFVVFSERCIDGWWQSGKASEPLDYRFHDLSDAMFVPGVCSVPNAVSNFFTGGISLQTLDGKTFIHLEKGTITIQGDIIHKGNTTQTGNLNQTGSTTVSETVTAQNVVGESDVTAGGISGKSHVHGNVESGNKTSGKPQ